MIKKYLLYLFRWQLSTPILAACVYILTKHIGATWTTIVANLIGGLIFFWIDRWIFTHTDILHTGELWEAIDNVVCADCGKVVDRGYRLLKAGTYDRTHDKAPQFRCHECSRKKYARDKAEGRIGDEKPLPEDRS